ncbi:Scarecrow-like protein 4 [Abeliophyllum distichum]|uniref:Scarecrow-like protein 4 n=1 Tax=Abeliophyllum distichum TaxID=126358 RepID=A0ABD1RW51_9LAMI
MRGRRNPISISIPPSDLNRVIFSDPPKTSTWVTSPLPPTLLDDVTFTGNTSTSTSTSSPETSPSKWPIFKVLIKCARLSETDPENAIKSLIQLRDLVSQHGDPIERGAYYFHEALYNTVSISAKKTPTIYDTASEEFNLLYKVLNDACPYSKFSHLIANQATLLQAFTTRPVEKPKVIRISGIPTSVLGISPAALLLATGNWLRDFAKLLGLNFEFESVLTPLQKLNMSAF